MRWIFCLQKEQPERMQPQKTNISLNRPRFIIFLRILPNFSEIRCCISSWYLLKNKFDFPRIIQYAEAFLFGYQYEGKQNLNWPEIMETWHVCFLKFQTPNFRDFNEKCSSLNESVWLRFFLSWKRSCIWGVRIFHFGNYLFVLTKYHTQCGLLSTISVFILQICTTLKVQMEFQMTSNAASFR